MSRLKKKAETWCRFSLMKRKTPSEGTVSNSHLKGASWEAPQVTGEHVVK